MTRNALLTAANKTIKTLKAADALRDEDALTVALIKELCAEWGEAVTSTQRSAISKELRYCLGMLPPIPEETDDVADLLAELADDDG